jgi:hypothetical protein
MAVVRKPGEMPEPGEIVWWKRIGGEWVCGEFLGLAPGDNGQGDCFVAVRAPNGVVHVRLSALTGN